MNTEKLICQKCNLPLTMNKTALSYLGHYFNVELPQCPGCGQIYLSEDLVRGKIAAVEMEMEDK